MAIPVKTLKLARPQLLLDKLLVNGDWKAAAGVFAVLDPATQGHIASVADGTAEDATLAIDAAATAFQSFRKTTARERSDLLRRWALLVRENAQDLAQIVSTENGKPLAEATGEIIQCVQTFEWFSELAPHYNGAAVPSQNHAVRITILRQPVGVCGIITPWNFPALMLARKAGAAIGAGCTAVVKPAEDTPLSALALAFLGEEAGLPTGVLNVVPTRSHMAAVGSVLTESTKVAKITFTGSTPVGKMLMKQAASTVKKVSFELGGNAPFMVFDDANVDKAVEGALISKFRGSGQTCVCANRFFVQSGVYDEFVTKLGRAVEEKLRPGHALDEFITQGPLINKRSMEKVCSHVTDAIAKNGRIITGGKPLPELGPLFFAPTVIADLDPESARVFSEETFGPFAAIAKFESEEDAVRLANNNEAGLAAYFYTSNIGRAHRVAEALEVGMVGVNTGVITEVALPFGGVKESGFGRENSVYGLDDYTVMKSVATNIA